MNFIVAVDTKWGIGKNNDLLFSIPEDMKYFKEHTLNKTVVLGDITLYSLPNGKPLPKRKSIVMTLNPDFECEGTIICHSLDDLKKVLESENTDDVFVMGGAAIYTLLEPYCKKAYITKVNADGEAEKFIPNLDEMDNWKCVSTSEVKEHNGLTFTFNEYENTDVKSL